MLHRKFQASFINVIDTLTLLLEKFIKKGDKIYIEGKLKTRTWQDKEGNNRYST